MHGDKEHRFCEDLFAVWVGKFPDVCAHLLGHLGLSDDALHLFVGQNTALILVEVAKDPIISLLVLLFNKPY